jgi:hypothetical protein
MIYSDAFTWPCPQGFAADLISPPAGAPIHEPVKAVWIVEATPSGAHSRMVMASQRTSKRHPDSSTSDTAAAVLLGLDTRWV